MKKIILNIVLAALCLNFAAKAQENKAVDLTAKGIQIGQQVPDITIANLHNYRDKDGKPASTAKISDFKGKLLILDFWATWCSPCVSMIPKMDSLQKAFNDKVQFLSVTYQSDKDVLPFLEKFEKQKGKHYDLAVFTDEKQLHQFFPHVYLPHYVWIDGNGIVQAITEAYYVTSEKISSIMKNGAIQAKAKIDVPIKFDKSKSLFFLTNQYTNTLLKQSTFSGYVEGIGRGYTQNITVLDTNRLKRMTVRNYTILELYQAAYQREQKETLIEVKDVTKLVHKTPIANDFRDWLRKGNAYCYELVIDSSLSSNGFQIMRDDLKNHFKNYEVSVEKRKVKCLTLIRTSIADKIQSAGGTPVIQLDRFGGNISNCPLSVFTARMKFYLQKYPLPLADGTGYVQMADLNLQANLSDLNDLNTALSKYDLQFVERDALIDMLIIRDK